MFLALYSNVFHSTSLCFSFSEKILYRSRQYSCSEFFSSSVRFGYLSRAYWQLLFSFSSERFWYLLRVSFWDFFGFFFSNIQLAFLPINKKLYIIKIFSYFSTALRCGSFSEKTSKKSTCAVMIRIIITYANEVFL